jgi:hypothetical protein
MHVACLVGAEEKKEDEKQPEPPVARMLTPLIIPTGSNLTMRVRGDFLDKAHAMLLESDAGSQRFDLKEKKGGIDAVKGFDNKDIGGTMCLAEVTIPVEWSGKPFTVKVLADAGESECLSGQVAGENDRPEHEPNAGFQQAQAVELNQTVYGSIENDKDVDVFSLSLKANQRVRISVRAHAGTAVLDPLVTLYDAQGVQVDWQDDVGFQRDPNFVFDPAAEGDWFIVVQDAHRLGGEWHAYVLAVSEERRP